MTKRKRPPGERERRAKITSFLQELNVSSVADVQNLFKELIGNVLESGLEGELDEELGYSKYDYRNKDTDNNRNGHSSKNLKTSFGETEIEIPRDRKGEFEPNLLGNSGRIRYNQRAWMLDFQHQARYDKPHFVPLRAFTQNAGHSPEKA